MKFTAKQYAQALHDAVSDTKPADLDKVLDNFAKVLVENGDLRVFEEIAEEFHKLELKAKGIKQVEVISAHPLDSSTERQVLDEMNRLANSKVQIKKKIDENLIGGVVIRMDDLEIDASVKNNLKQLKDNLVK
jgi:F-type H+-transporting ATPase subunit delta